MTETLDFERCSEEGVSLGLLTLLDLVVIVMCMVEGVGFRA